MPLAYLACVGIQRRGDYLRPMRRVNAHVVRQLARCPVIAIPHTSAFIPGRSCRQKGRARTRVVDPSKDHLPSVALLWRHCFIGPEHPALLSSGYREVLEDQIAHITAAMRPMNAKINNATNHAGM